MPLLNSSLFGVQDPKSLVKLRAEKRLETSTDLRNQILNLQKLEEDRYSNKITGIESRLSDIGTGVK